VHLLVLFGTITVFIMISCVSIMCLILKGKNCNFCWVVSPRGTFLVQIKLGYLEICFATSSLQQHIFLSGMLWFTPVHLILLISEWKKLMMYQLDKHLEGS